MGKGSERVCRYSDNGKNLRFIFLYPSGGRLSEEMLTSMCQYGVV